jgi:RHS repeat-associated protein
MKKLTLLKLLIVATMANTLAQSPYLPANYATTVPVNHVKVYEPTAPFTSEVDVISSSRTINEVKRTTQYFDGLGRPIQTVSWQTTPLKKDMVMPMVYDEFGREQYKFIPYVATSNDGNLKYDPFTAQQAFNTAQYGAQGETFFYSKTEFEASPLNRPLKTMAQGNSWVGNNKGVEQKLYFNTLADEVRIWTIGYVETDVPVSIGTYLPTELNKAVGIDEHNKKVIVFTDKDGNTILKKVQIDNTIGDNHTGWLCTYYVYNDFNQLRYVIQPKGVNLLLNNNWSFVNTPNAGATLKSELCFYYNYDSKGRMVVKKVPGAGEVHMVYDERDRLVMTQDANMRLPSFGGAGGGPAWMVTIYDELNRPLKTGLWTNANTRTYHETQAALQTTTIAYPFATEPTTNWELLTQTGYDDYTTVPAASGLNASLISTNITATNFVTTYNAAPNYAQQIVATTATRGMPTWTKVKVLDATNTYLYTVTLYDDYGRAIQSKSKNITGGTDVATMQYDFSGKVLRTHLSHQKAGTNPNIYQVLTKPSYDHIGRVLSVTKNIGTTTIIGIDKIINVNTYNELGQLKTKALGQIPPLGGGGALENLNYDYNIRGWLLGINRDYAKDVINTNYFGFDLGYDKTANNLIGNSTYSKAQFNGNIAGTVWKSKGDGEKRKFDYDYDNANRLLKADFNQYTGGSFNQTAGLNFNVVMGTGALLADGSVDYSTAYDENGNIKKMQQWGWKIGGSIQIDNLTYNYIANTNKLKAVADAVTVNNKLGDFFDKNTTAIDYTYDDNGNLKKDLNKDIGTATTDGIVYNYLNLPVTITVRNSTGIKGTIEYVYDATGTKLCKKTTEGTNTITKTTYTSGFVYESKTGVQAAADVLQFTGHEEGRIRPIFNSQLSIVNFVNDYMLKDHLGNVRMVLTEEQKQNVYPAATLEVSNIATESIIYGGLTDTQTPRPSWFGNSTANGSKVAKVKNASGSQKVGPNIVLKVMSGDSYNLQVTSGWSSAATPTQGTSSNVLNDLLNLISGSISGSSNGKATQAQLQAATSGINTNLINFLATQTNTGNKPKAYINWLVFNEQFKVMQSGFEQVGAGGITTIHTKPNLTINTNGYLYIYTSNESDNIDVFFDNLQVTHIRGAILDETHYSAWGGKLDALCSKAMEFGGASNLYKYNGKEEQCKEFSDGSGLELYDYSARMYDAQIGRFNSVDPLADVPHSIGMSPYCAMANNPINNIDPDGADWVEGKDGGVKWNDNVTAKNYQDKGILGEGETYRGTSYERIKNWDNVKLGSGETVNNMVLEQYGTNKKMTYDEFASASISVDGAMREGNDKLGDVTIKVTANFKSGASRVMDGGFAGVAGGFGNGAPENGNYTLDSYQDRGPKGWYNKGMTNDGVGFSYNLNPTFSTGRTLLRMHPDGNKEGTLGCIGVSGGASTLLGLSTNINWVLRRQTSIPTVISITGNPNNNGRSGKKIPNVNE